MPPTTSRRGSGRRPGLWACRSLMAGLAAAAVLLVALPAPAGAAGAPAATQQVTLPVYSSAALADSIGVNVHLGYQGNAYSDFPVVERLLVGLGIHHIRTALPRNPPPAFYSEVTQLAASGIRTDLILGSADTPKGGDGALEPVAVELSRIDSQGLAPALDSIEGPNEWDSRGGPRWAEEDRAYQEQLYAAVKADPALSGIPVVGPSTANTSHKPALGALDAYLDYGNNHSYPRGAQPLSNLPSALAGEQVVSGTKPIMATETGYQTATAGNDQQPPVSSSTQSVYLPWLYTSYFQAGVVRTYDYELLDEHADPTNTVQEDHFGIVGSDGTPKPAYSALQNLVALLGPSTAGAAISDRAPTGSLTLQMSAAAAASDHLLVRKADGSYLLLLWRPQSVPATAADAITSVQATQVAIDAASYAATTYRPTLHAAALHAFSAGSSVQGSLGPDLAVVQLAPTPQPGTTVVPASQASGTDAFGQGGAGHASAAAPGSSHSSSSNTAAIVAIAAAAAAVAVAALLVAARMRRRRA